jgi:hypothetical protein
MVYHMQVNDDKFSLIRIIISKKPDYNVKNDVQ